MRKMARESNMSNGTLRNIVHKDLKISVFQIQKRQLLSEATKQKRMTRAQQLLKNLTDKHASTREVIWTDEKLFIIEAAFNPKSDTVLGKSLDAIAMSSQSHYRRQKPASVMVWAGVSATWKSPLIFVPEGVKINSMSYIEDILVPAAAAAKEHFKSRPWTLQQDGASAHTANVTQKWCTENLPGFWE